MASSSVTTPSRDMQGPPAAEEGDSAVPRGDLIRILDYDTLGGLPQPRAQFCSYRSLMTQIHTHATTPEHHTSRDYLFRFKPISKPKPDANLLRRFQQPPEEHPSHRLDSSLLRTRLRSHEFPRSTLNFITRTGLTPGWRQWVEDFFERGGEPLRTLERVGIKDAIWITTRLQTRRHSADLEFLVQRWSNITHTFVTAWGEFTPTLEDVYVLLRLPCFGTANILDREVPAAVAAIASRLKFAATESSYYTKTLARRSVRIQTYAGWIRYFFGIAKFRNKGTEEEERVVEASLDHKNKDLELPALIAFWLDRYVFPGPCHWCLSAAVFVFAAMLAQGMRLPLAPMYLGGLYGRLDQVQEQFKISRGRFRVNNYADIKFLSLFLFERFSKYAPPRALPPEYSKGDTAYEAPRAWAWLNSKEAGAKVQCSLADVIDKEAYFCFRPYIVDSSHEGFERRSRIYGFCLTEWDDRADMYEGVYDFWRLCCRVGTLVGFVVTDSLGGTGGAAFPSLYRPDRVARQFGWVQMPTTTDMDMTTVREAYSEFLLLNPGEGDVACPSFVPRPEYKPGVSAAWLTYHASLISSLRRAEQNRKNIPRISLSIFYNDPYYSTVTVSKRKRAAQEIPKGDSKRQRIKATAKTTPTKSGLANILDEGGTGQAATSPSSIHAPSSTSHKRVQCSSRTSPSFEDALEEVDMSVSPQMILPSTISAPTESTPRLSNPSQHLIKPCLRGDACKLQERAPRRSSSSKGHYETSRVRDSKLQLDVSPSREAQSGAVTSLESTETEERTETRKIPPLPFSYSRRKKKEDIRDKGGHHDDIASKRGLEHPASSEVKEHRETEFHRDMGVREEEHLEAKLYDETAANKEECCKRSSADGEAHRGGEKHIVPSTDVVDSAELPCEGGVTHVEEHPQGDTISPLVHPGVEKELSFLTLPTDSIAVLGPFLTAHPAMRLTTSPMFRCMAYKCLCKFLLFAGTQPLSALLSDKRGDFINFMDALVDFSFDSTWLDDIRALVTSPSHASPPRVLEQVLLNKQRVSAEITRLESEVKALKSEMESLEEQESHLRSLLDAPLLKL